MGVLEKWERCSEVGGWNRRGWESDPYGRPTLTTAALLALSLALATHRAAAEKGVAQNEHMGELVWLLSLGGWRRGMGAYGGKLGLVPPIWVPVGRVGSEWSHTALTP